MGIKPVTVGGQESLFRNHLMQQRRNGYTADHVLIRALAAQLEEWGFKPVVRWMHYYIKIIASGNLAIYVYVLGNELKAMRGFTQSQGFRWSRDLSDPNCINGLHGFLTQMDELEVEYLKAHGRS